VRLTKLLALYNTQQLFNPNVAVRRAVIKTTANHRLVHLSPLVLKQGVIANLQFGR